MALAAQLMAHPRHAALRARPHLSPWHGAKQDHTGEWHLPYLPCEIKGLAKDDPRNQPWRPGEWVPDVDNVDQDENNERREWGGQKMWEGEVKPSDWDPKRLPDSTQRLMEIPHMPGQPMKEMFARQKALDPRRFEDKLYDETVRVLPDGWQTMVRHVRWAEEFGVHTKESPAEWRGLELESSPAVSTTLHADIISLCVGYVKSEESGDGGATELAVPDAEFDCLDYLYAKDQEGKIVTIQPYTPLFGSQKSSLVQYSFIPPEGTSSITPFACFRLKGVWQGPSIVWDPEIKNKEMQWFTDMPPEMRRVLCEPEKLTGKNKVAVARIKYPKAQKQEPVLWPENSWEGNAAKARLWDSTST